MIRTPLVPTLFVDVGGVLLTDGWDQQARRRAAASFQLEPAEMAERHRRLRLTPAAQSHTSFVVPRHRVG